jgi:hypothetical protein
MRPRVVHNSPFIRTPDALRAELAAKPLNVIHQNNPFHTEPRCLNSGRACRLVSTHNEQIRLNQLRPENSREHQQNKQQLPHN